MLTYILTTFYSSLNLVTTSYNFFIVLITFYSFLYLLTASYNFLHLLITPYIFLNLTTTFYSEKEQALTHSRGKSCTRNVMLPLITSLDPVIVREELEEIAPPGASKAGFRLSLGP